MLNPSTKEAIKISLSIGLAIALALLFQWDKPYWAAVTIIAISANETFGHGVKKGQLRLLGTLIGISIALILISLFSQDQFIFISLFVVFLGISVFFSNHLKYGYAFTMAFMVFSIVAMMGSASGEVSFNIAILRIQETTLGVLVYSAVYRFLWPTTTESIYFDTLNIVTKQFEAAYTTLEKSLADSKRLTSNSAVPISQVQVDRLNELLSLPLVASYRLQHHKAKWQDITNACGHTEKHIQRLNSLITAVKCKQTLKDSLEQLQCELTLLKKAIGGDSADIKMLNEYWNELAHNSKQNLSNNPNPNLWQLNLRKAFTAMAISATCFGLWIYFAIPSGPIFPLIGAALANITVQMPGSLIKQAQWVALGWGTLFIAQYSLLLPHITELWQLIAFYVFNMLFIYGLCRKPSLAVHRMLGGNLLLLMTMNAMHGTPQYDIITPVLMLVIMLICLSISHFYVRLFQI